MRQGCAKRLVDGLGDGVGIAVPLLYEEGRDTPHHSLRRESSVLRALGEAVIGNTRAGRFPALSEMVTDPAAYRRPTRADWATGALMAISGDCLAACGPWDESFFLYSEETEYCLRARDRGYGTRLEPTAEAVHLGGDSQVSPRLWTLLTLNRVRLYRRRHGPSPRPPSAPPSCSGKPHAPCSAARPAEPPPPPSPDRAPCGPRRGRDFRGASSGVRVAASPAPRRTGA
ncbi:hypothetical protein O1M54_05915 [Streptomyces diastatochromogenes]|nr:hypothetical protein [Streptomyces diastatochromogenes]